MKKWLYKEFHREKLFLNVVIYIRRIYRIGGMETWLYYTCKRYNKGQITVLYENSDAEQLRRLKKVVNLVHYEGQEVHAKKMIFPAPVYCDEELCRFADEKILINHVNYGDVDNNEQFTLPELDRIYAVSKVCRDSCKKRMNGDIMVLYNPVEIEKPKKVLKLVTACRWGKSKGSEQMLEFARRLDENGIHYMWFVFTDDEPPTHSPNMYFMKPRLDLASVIAGCDWGIQFTTKESYGYFPQECLECGTPVILTDLPVFREVGIDENNALFYDLYLNGPDVKELLNVKKVKYKRPSSDKEYKELFS